MKLAAYLLSSLDTVFSDETPICDTLEYTSMLRNEAFSFQLALSCLPEESDDRWANTMELYVKVVTPIECGVKLYLDENVPVVRVGYRSSDDWFLRKSSGLYPDRLVPLADGNLTVPNTATRTLHITVNEDLTEVSSGSYPITVEVYRRKRHERDAKEIKELICKKELTLDVMNELLPKQKLVATNWMHYDCMAHFSDTEPFSDDFFDVMKSYIRLSAVNGQNMVLLPAFTPPLDTPVGAERMTAQLVSVTRENGNYSFDFSLFDRFVTTCLELGIEYFEHSHLFSQWGAQHAPKIVVCENGENVKAFGWQTDATGDEYTEFLRSYITELKKHLCEQGWEKRFFFHISDEPEMRDLDSYGKVSGLVHDLLGDMPSGDALSEYKLYEDGLVKIPIVATDNIDKFIGKAEHLWAYYTGMQSSDSLSNRLIGMPESRGRILGTELYYHGIEGFLNWGFNAHHNRLSRKMIDPRTSADMGMDFVGGTSYLVYPNDSGFAEPSVRLLTFRDAMQDIRAMQLLESKTGRDAVCKIIKKHIPNISFNVRVDKKQLTSLRKEINEAIKQASSGK